MEFHWNYLNLLSDIVILIENIMNSLRNSNNSNEIQIDSNNSLRNLNNSNVLVLLARPLKACILIQGEIECVTFVVF